MVNSFGSRRKKRAVNNSRSNNSRPTSFRELQARRRATGVGSPQATAERIAFRLSRRGEPITASGIEQEAQRLGVDPSRLPDEVRSVQQAEPPSIVDMETQTLRENVPLGQAPRTSQVIPPATMVSPVTQREPPLKKPVASRRDFTPISVFRPEQDQRNGVPDPLGLFSNFQRPEPAKRFEDFITGRRAVQMTPRASRAVKSFKTSVFGEPTRVAPREQTFTGGFTSVNGTKGDARLKITTEEVQKGSLARDVADIFIPDEKITRADAANLAILGIPFTKVTKAKPVISLAKATGKTGAVVGIETGFTATQPAIEGIESPFVRGAAKTARSFVAGRTALKTGSLGVLTGSSVVRTDPQQLRQAVRERPIESGAEFIGFGLGARGTRVDRLQVEQRSQLRSLQDTGKIRDPTTVTGLETAIKFQKFARRAPDPPPGSIEGIIPSGLTRAERGVVRRTLTQETERVFGGQALGVRGIRKSEDIDIAARQTLEGRLFGGRGEQVASQVRQQLRSVSPTPRSVIGKGEAIGLRDTKLFDVKEPGRVRGFAGAQRPVKTPEGVPVTRTSEQFSRSLSGTLQLRKSGRDFRDVVLSGRALVGEAGQKAQATITPGLREFRQFRVRRAEKQLAQIEQATPEILGIIERTGGEVPKLPPTPLEGSAGQIQFLPSSKKGQQQLGTGAQAGIVQKQAQLLRQNQRAGSARRLPRQRQTASQILESSRIGVTPSRLPRASRFDVRPSRIGASTILGTPSRIGVSRLRPNGSELLGIDRPGGSDLLGISRVEPSRVGTGSRVSPSLIEPSRVRTQNVLKPSQVTPSKIQTTGDILFADPVREPRVQKSFLFRGETKRKRRERPLPKFPNQFRPSQVGIARAQFEGEFIRQPRKQQLFTGTGTRGVPRQFRSFFGRDSLGLRTGGRTRI